jgi:hypothetical protein
MRMFKDSAEWFLRGIGNKKGEMTFTLYDFAHGVIIDDVPWREYTPLPEGLREAIQKEVDDKVHPFVYQYQQPRGKSGQTQTALTTGPQTGTTTGAGTGTVGSTRTTAGTDAKSFAEAKSFTYEYIRKHSPEILGEVFTMEGKPYQKIIVMKPEQVWEIFDINNIEEIASTTIRQKAVSIMEEVATTLLGVDCRFSDESETFIMEFAEMMFNQELRR